MKIKRIFEIVFLKTVSIYERGSFSGVPAYADSVPVLVYFNLPDSEIQRSLVVIEKMKPTSGRYPRKAGTPLKEPLS